MRILSSSRFIWSIVFFAVLACTASSAVIGIDFGTEYFKISLISPGKSFVIVENLTSKRKTPTTISFHNGERIYEQDAVNKRSRNPQKTFVFMQKYLGALVSNIKLLELAKENFEDYIFELDTERNTFKFELKDFQLHEDSTDERVFISVEEITAMILKYAKKLSEHQGNIEIKDCVITVPSNWGLDQKRALIDSANLAGLHVLGFIGENTAAALYYGIERSDEEKTHTVVFYNLGSSSLKVSLVEYQAVNSTDKSYKKPIETIKVLADSVEEEVSGNNFDHVLVNHFADIFDNLPSRKHKTSVRQSTSAMIKLNKECNKLKEVLSANKESPFYIENLYDNEDFVSHITRQTFEERSSHILQKLVNPIESVLLKANKTLKDVDRLEILGGAVRIPKVQQILSEYLNGVELGAHLNGDEAMALGAAFHAANLSHSFKVRPIWLYDGNNFEVELVIKNLGELSEEESYYKKLAIFPFKQRFGSKKVISFTYGENVNCELYAKYEGEEEGKLIASFNFANITDIKNIEKYAKFGKPKLHFQFGLYSTWPVADVELAEATFEEIKMIEIEESARKRPNKDNNSSSNETFNESTSKNETTPENDNSTNSEDSNSTNVNKKQKKKVITHYIPLKIERKFEGLGTLSSAKIEASKKTLIEFDKHEEFLKKNSESKNKLEAYIYKVRDYLIDEEFLKHTSPTEKANLEKLSAEYDDWLYSDEAFASNFTVFNKKYHKIYSIASDIVHRVEESKKRPNAIANANLKLAEFEKKIRDLNKTMYWVNDTQKAPAIAEIEKIREWIKEKHNQQETKPLYEDPVFTVGQLEYKLKDVKEAYLNLKNIKKPKEPKKKAAKNETKTEEANKAETKKEEDKKEDHTHEQDLELKDPEKEQVSEREDL